jgi:acetylornithine/LysW-gamma-L-lysine aminotransferase
VSRVRALEDRWGAGMVPKRPIELVRGEGARVWDSEGREYIDCMAGVGVANVGHCHPAVVSAIQDQAARLITQYDNTYSAARADLYEELARAVPPGLDRFFLCNSGAEAVEACLKFARATTGRPGVVSFKRGFHGKTFGALSATAVPTYQDPVAPLLEGFVSLRYDDVEAVQTHMADHGATTGAVLVELVQGEGGVHVASSPFVETLRALCDEHGALLIVDEVQTGIGRTGHTFACEHFALRPDLLAAAKGLGAGLPIGVAAFRASIGELPSRVHSSTFGGNPVVCAAAAAVLRILEVERLPERAQAMGARLRRGIESLRLSKVRQVRGLGLMVGVDLKTRAGRFLGPLADRGVLALLAGSTVLRLLPPLVISEEEVDRVVATLGDVLRD